MCYSDAGRLDKLCLYASSLYAKDNKCISQNYPSNKNNYWLYSFIGFDLDAVREWFLRWNIKSLEWSLWWSK